MVSRDEPCDTCTEESESVLSGARRGESVCLFVCLLVCVRGEELVNV